MDLNRTILDELLGWGRALDGFAPEHAENALSVVQGYMDGVGGETGGWIDGIGIKDPDKLRLFAMDLTWTFWLDEFFDGRGDKAYADLDSIVRAILDGPATTPEARGFYELRSQFGEYAQAKADYRLWQDTAVAAVTSWTLEERLTKGLVTTSYAEYLENGVNSTAVPHIVATASLLYGFKMAARLGEEPVRRLVRDLSISCRLHNDLFSAQKERDEGCMANAVLLLDRLLPGVQAHVFVADELKGYERMLGADIEALGGADPFSRLARIMPESHRVLYTASRGRYSPAT
jgi:hypothetical protein